MAAQRRAILLIGLCIPAHAVKESTAAAASGQGLRASEPCPKTAKAGEPCLTTEVDDSLASIRTRPSSLAEGSLREGPVEFKEIRREKLPGKSNLTNKIDLLETQMIAEPIDEATRQSLVSQSRDSFHAAVDGMSWIVISKPFVPIVLVAMFLAKLTIEGQSKLLPKVQSRLQPHDPEPAAKGGRILHYSECDDTPSPPAEEVKPHTEHMSAPPTVTEPTKLGAPGGRTPRRAGKKAATAAGKQLPVGPPMEAGEGALPDPPAGQRPGKSRGRRQR